MSCQPTHPLLSVVQLTDHLLKIIDVDTYVQDVLDYLVRLEHLCANDPKLHPLEENLEIQLYWANGAMIDIVDQLRLLHDVASF